MMRILLGVCLLAASLVGQGTVYSPDSSATTGKVNIVPLGGKGPSGSFQTMRTQVIVPRSALSAGGSKITDLGFAAADVGEYRYKSIEVRLAHLKGSKPVAKFAGNLSGAVTVLKKAPFVYKFAKKDSWAFLGLTGSFLHDGKRDLVIDLTIVGAYFTGSTAGSHRSDKAPQKVYMLNYNATKHTSGYGPYDGGPKIALKVLGQGVVSLGPGCKGSDQRIPSVALTPRPALGKTSTVRLASGLPKAIGVLFLGNSDTLFGALKLPMGLDSFGAKGCFLRTNILVMNGLQLDAAGQASQSIPIPSTSTLKGGLLVFQWAVVDAKANALGLSFSNGAKATIQ